MLFWATCKRQKALLDSKKIFASGSKIHCEWEASFFPFLCISAMLNSQGASSLLKVLLFRIIETRTNHDYI